MRVEGVGLGSRFRVVRLGVGFGIEGVGFGVWGLGFGSPGSRLQDPGLGFGGFPFSVFRRVLRHSSSGGGDMSPGGPAGVTCGQEHLWGYNSA